MLIIKDYQKCVSLDSILSYLSDKKRKYILTQDDCNTLSDIALCDDSVWNLSHHSICQWMNQAIRECDLTMQLVADLIARKDNVLDNPLYAHITAQKLNSRSFSPANRLAHEIIVHGDVHLLKQIIGY